MQHKTNSVLCFNPLYLAILFCLICHSRAFVWVLFPECAQPELQRNAPERCDVATSIDRGKCLCADSDFLSGSAKSIWQACGCDVLEESVSLTVSTCSYDGASMALSQAQMLAAGDGTTGTCVEPSSTASPSTPSGQNSNPVNTLVSAASGSSSSSSSKSGSSGGGGLSVTTQVIIGVVVSVVGTAFSAAVAWYIYKRQRKDSQKPLQQNP